MTAGVRALTGSVWVGVQPAAAGGAFTLDVSELDDAGATLAAGSFELVDVTAYVRALSTDRGRTGPYGPFRTGLASVTLGNQTGAVTYSVDPSSGAIRPGAPVVIGGRLDGAGPIVTAFTGIVDAFAVSRNHANTDEILRLECTDGRRQIAETFLDPVSAVGAGDTPDARVARILDMLDPVPDGAARNLEADVTTTLQASTFDRALLDHIEEAEAASGGAYYIDRLGRHTWRTRNYRPAVTVAASDAPAATYRLDHLDARYSSEYVRNKITLTRVGGTPQSQVDVDSIASLRRERSYIRGDLINQNDTQVADLARKLIGDWTQTVLVSPIVLNAARTPWAGVVATLELLDELQLSRTFTTQTLTVTVRVDRVSHTWRAGAPWVATLDVSAVQETFTLGSLEFGELGDDELG